MTRYGPHSSHLLPSQKFYFSILAFLLFLFAATVSSTAQDNFKLVEPELFEKMLPNTLNGDWEKSNFSARSSETENWGGATYMGPGNAYMQLGLRHFTHSEWKKNKAGDKEDGEVVDVGEHTGYLGTTMGQAELVVYFGNNFSARIVGSGLSSEDLVSLLKQLPFQEVNNLAVGKSKVEKPKKKTNYKIATLLPDTLAGMMRGRIRTARNKPIAAVTYGNEKLPYSVNIRIATGEPMHQAKSSIKEELNEPDTDLQQINHNSHKIWFREEESAVSFTVFIDKYILILSADAPANITFDKKSARSHLFNAFEKLEKGI